ncbi:hypothetical protein V1478_000924 [Vespula squamosa]|uniref:Uncharacterized protein n=1 Tax=Vespula squamosa TaxID=30214 RepID=A0ABD2C6V8_VESSQ
MNKKETKNKKRKKKETKLFERNDEAIRSNTNNVAPPCCPSFPLTYDPSSEARTLGQGRVGRPPRESSGIFGNRRIRGSREFRHGAPPCCPLLEPSNSRGSSSRQQQQQQQKYSLFMLISSLEISSFEDIL